MEKSMWSNAIKRNNERLYETFFHWHEIFFVTFLVLSQIDKVFILPFNQNLYNIDMI